MRLLRGVGGVLGCGLHELVPGATVDGAGLQGLGARGGGLAGGLLGGLGLVTLHRADDVAGLVEATVSVLDALEGIVERVRLVLVDVQHLGELSLKLLDAGFELCNSGLCHDYPSSGMRSRQDNPYRTYRYDEKQVLKPEGLELPNLPSR